MRYKLSRYAHDVFKTTTTLTKITNGSSGRTAAAENLLLFATSAAALFASVQPGFLLQHL